MRKRKKNSFEFTKKKKKQVLVNEYTTEKDPEELKYTGEKF